MRSGSPCCLGEKGARLLSGWERGQLVVWVGTGPACCLGENGASLLSGQELASLSCG